MSLSNSSLDANATGPAKIPPGSLPPPPPPPVRPAPIRGIPAAGGNTPPRTEQSGIGSANRGIYWRGELAVEAEKLPSGELPDEDRKLSIEKAAPPWLISLVLHLLLLLILALLVSPAGRGLSSIVLEMAGTEDTGDALDSFELAEAEPAVDDSLESDPMLVDPQPLEMPEEIFSPESLLESLEPTQLSIASVSIPVGGMVSGRSGASKEALLAAYGGNAETEDAVQLGLQWLAKQQESNGSWSMRGPYANGGLTENRIAATAMALLAFQGNGNTHLNGPYKKQVEKGVRWLVNQQDRSGYFGKGLERHQKMYAQAQASIAICELYAMTNDSWLRDPAQRSLDFAAESQSNLGGWRYEPREDADTSVTGWFVMALQSGKAGGLNANPETLRRVDYYLDSAQSADGAAYGYQAGSPPTPAMTAEGMLCRQYLGWKREDPRMAECMSALVEQAPFDFNEQNFYYWYYATQTLHHYGGSPWRMWNEKMRVQLPAAQVKTGRDAGSWAPQGSRWGGQAGRLYTTCMAIYCLEVYYRHMPLYSMDISSQ